jgi:hypothetical protein
MTSTDPLGHRELEQARADALIRGWSILETLGGVIAVPLGTEVVSGVTVEILACKLRDRPSPLVREGS